MLECECGGRGAHAPSRVVVGASAEDGVDPAWQACGYEVRHPALRQRISGEGARNHNRGLRSYSGQTAISFRAEVAGCALIESHDDPGNNPVVKLAKKVFRTVDFFDGKKFFTRRTIAPHYIKDPESGKDLYAPAEPGTLSAKRAVTPLFLALIMVDVTDLVFAVDSIPAITPDPFIVFKSNIFAILGLRALYFCLAALIAKFRFLKPALIPILAYVGVELLLLALPPYLNDWGLSATEVKSIKIDPILSLVIVLATLTVASVMAVLMSAKDQEAIK